MDPMLDSAVNAATKAVVSKVFDGAVTVGGKVLARFRRQPEAARELARQNQEQFLINLAVEVERIAALADRFAAVEERIDDSLSDPDFWLLTQDALYTSARTSGRGKHRVLAKLIAERLTVSSDDLLARTSALAVSAMQHLTSVQMRFLGLATLTTSIRPPIYPPADPRDEFLRWYVGWLNRQASVYLPFDTPAVGDYEHMRLVSCVYLAETLPAGPLKGFSAIRPGLMSRIPPPTDVLPVSWPEKHRSFWDEFRGSPLSMHLGNLYETGVAGVNLTAVGELIGRHVHEELLASQPATSP